MLCYMKVIDGCKASYIDGVHDLLRGGVDTRHDLDAALRGGGPEHHHLVQRIGRLEVANVAADDLQLLRSGALDDIICAVVLVGRDVVLRVDAG